MLSVSFNPVNPVNSSWFSNVPNSTKTRVHNSYDLLVLNANVQSVINYKCKMPHSSFTYNGIKNFEVPKKRAFFLTEYSRLSGLVFPPGTLCFRPYGDNLYCVLPADFGDLYSNRKNIKAFHFTYTKTWEYETPCKDMEIRLTLWRILLTTGKGDEDSARYSEKEMNQAFKNKFECGHITSLLYKVTYSIKGKVKYAYIKATSLVEAENIAKARYPHIERVKKVAG